MEKTIEFMIDGVLAGSSTLIIENGEINTEIAEEAFWKAVRYSRQQLIDEEREYIIDNLTKEQETKLEEEAIKEYHGAKDGWEDYFEVWLEEADLDTLKKILA